MSKAQSKSKDEQHQFWQMVLETFTASGLSVRQFCKQEGLTEASFYFWRKRLTQQLQVGKEEICRPESFIQVSLPKDTRSGLELILTSGNTLRIGEAADSKTLSDVLSVLREAGLC